MNYNEIKENTKEYYQFISGLKSIISGSEKIQNLIIEKGEYHTPNKATFNFEGDINFKVELYVGHDKKTLRMKGIDKRRAGLVVVPYTLQLKCLFNDLCNL